ncbi:MAG: DUF58 domain-containing protein [Clostridia bacterium]|nr:DUF58 domain-containing protein [Clostridia bacterium]
MSEFFDGLYRFIQNFNAGFIAMIRYINDHPWLMTLVILTLVFIVLVIVLVIVYRKLKGKFLERLIYKREYSVPDAYAGQSVTLTETIFNPTLFPFFRVDVEEYLPRGLWIDGARPGQAPAAVEEEPKKKKKRPGKKKKDEEPVAVHDDEQEPIVSRFTLMPFMQTKRRHEVYCETRGFYEISSVRIERRGEPLFISAPAELYVFPKLVDPMINSFPVSCLLGEYTSQRRLIQDPFSFSGIRDYRFGDPTGIINYKATARHPVFSASDIMVNMRDYCTGRIFMVYQNFHLQNAGKGLYDNYDAIMEYGLSVCSALIRDAVNNGCKVGFAGNCPVDGARYLRYPMLSSDEHYKQIMKGFAALRISDGISIKMMVQDDIDAGLNNAEIILLTTYVDDELDDRLRVLKQYNNAVSVIHLSEEDLKE